MFPILLDENAANRALIPSLQHLTTVHRAIDHLPRGAADETQLLCAYSLGAVLYSFDTDDFPRIHRDWLRGEQPHAGIILNPLQAMPVGIQLEALARLLATFDSSEMQHRLEYLTNWRRPS